MKRTTIYKYAVHTPCPQVLVPGDPKLPFCHVILHMEVGPGDDEIDMSDPPYLPFETTRAVRSADAAVAEYWMVVRADRILRPIFPICMMRDEQY